jgi:uncharacterized protein (UPF0303 family)
MNATTNDPDPLPQLDAEEAELVLPGFDNGDAWRLGVQLVEAARARGLCVSISIRRGGQRLFHAALPGTSADNDSWLDRKARVVERFGHSSFRVGTACRASGRSLEEIYGVETALYAAHGGAFPLTVRGTGIVGVVAVSGLPQAEDHAFVVDQLRSFLASGPAAAV